MAQWGFDSTSFMTVGSAGFSMDRLQTIANAYSLGPGAKINLTVNHLGQIHCFGNDPAVETSDGDKAYYWNGVEVPKHVAILPELITIAEIESETNLEVRRVMIERYGMARYLADCGAKCISRDQFGGLYEKRIGRIGSNRERIRFVKVKNSTPEPDGSIKDYCLRVPPDTLTAREGVAWTFGMTAAEYSPQKET
jgi:hypothetical protein